MRKIISIVLVLLMFVSCFTAGYAETEEENESSAVMFEATITKLLDNQAKEWFASEEMRAMVTILLSLDLSSELDKDSEAYPDLSQNTYVGKSSLDLIVYLHGQKKDVTIMYRPITGDAGYTIMNASTDEVVEIIMGAVCSDGYYKNDAETMYVIAQQIGEILSGES